MELIKELSVTLVFPNPKAIAAIAFRKLIYKTTTNKLTIVIMQ